MLIFTPFQRLYLAESLQLDFRCQEEFIIFASHFHCSSYTSYVQGLGSKLLRRCKIRKMPKYWPNSRMSAEILGQFFSAVLGKNPAGFHGNWDLFPFPCKCRSRGTTQTVTEEILLSHSHPNRSRGNPDFPFPPKRFPWKCLFPVVFRFRAVKARLNNDFQIPCK